MKMRRKGNCEIRIPMDIHGSIAFLVDQQDGEVAWFGDITVVDPDPLNLIIEIDEVYLYPQKVGGASVAEAVKGDGYDDWYIERMMEKGGEPTMQYYGHSHVSMSVQPSTVDRGHRDEQKTGLNVYSIHNKNGAHHWEIWTEDYIYPTEDIDIIVTGYRLEDTEGFIQKMEYTRKPINYNMRHGKSEPSYYADNIYTDKDEYLYEEDLLAYGYGNGYKWDRYGKLPE